MRADPSAVARQEGVICTGLRSEAFRLSGRILQLYRDAGLHPLEQDPQIHRKFIQKELRQPRRRSYDRSHLHGIPAVRLVTLLAVACSLAAAQTQDPAFDPLQRAYEALRSGNDAEAVRWFEQAAQLAPGRASIPKELGYVYLRLGDEQQSRRMFEQAAEIDPADGHTALEVAFGYQRAGDVERAQPWFERAAKSDNAEVQQTARRALSQLSKTQPAPNIEAFDPAREALDHAYAALRSRNYTSAITFLQEAIALAPKQPSIRKELAYAYLKIGETAWAREMFEQAVRLNPRDYSGALELAFLRYETKQIAEARTLFQTVRQRAKDPEATTAAGALARVDAELAQSIGRWKAAVEMDPLNRSAQLELADLYEKYGEPAKAVDHYLAAWLVPSGELRDEILPQLARARQAAGNTEGATGAWLLASRSAEIRIAEAAKEHLPKRYPWASEFRRALELNPRDTELRRDLAYLQLEVGNAEEARKEFEIIVRQNPNDLLSAAQLAYLYLDRNHPAEAVSLLERARQSTDKDVSRRAEETLRQTRETEAQPHRELGERSLEQSYLKDAQREFLRAYEINPRDFGAALKLGIIANLMRQDRDAMRWFLIAAGSPEPEIASQARKSYGNLAPHFQRFTTTLWTFPFFSTRYHDVFQYSQLKTEIRLGDLPIRPYLSLRFVGDLKQRTSEEAPQFLSESSLIAGFGLRTPTIRGITLWGEAGEAFSYLGDRPFGVPRAGPDYRGGVNWFHGGGAFLGSGRPGGFYETNIDAVYVSGFDDDAIAYWQLRPGYQLPNRGRFRAQLYWNLNVTADRNRAYWANFVEFGPGVRFRLAGGPRPLDFSINALRGVHLINQGNPRRPNYYDLRIGLWYSMAM